MAAQPPVCVVGSRVGCSMYDVGVSKFTCISSASQPAVRPGCAGCRAPEISHNKGPASVMVADLRKCCSEDDLPTAPW